MDSAHIATINKTPITFTRNVYFNAPNNTDTITEGMALCWDVTAAAVNRNVYVTKPNLQNASEFCGVVAPGVRQTGSGWVEVLICDGVIARGVSVFTDESIVAGDLLGIIPGEYALGRCVYGPVVARALNTVDRSVTAGLVETHFGMIEPSLGAAGVYSKILRLYDHFTGDRAVSATADAAGYASTLNGGAASFADSFTIADNANGLTVVKSGYGVLNLANVATANTEASIQCNGEPFSLAVGRNLFFQCRMALESPVAGVQAFVGLLPTDTSPIVSLNADYIGFITSTAAVNHVYVKDGATGLVTKATGHTLVANDFVDLAFIVRPKTATNVDIHIFVNGVEVAAPTETASEIVDNESLTFTAAIVNSAATAVNLRLDRIEINNYIG